MTNEELSAVPDLRKRSMGMYLALGVLAALVALVVAFLVYNKVTGPPAPEDVCSGLADVLGERTGEGTAAIRASYPRGYSPPPPGSLVQLVGKEQVEDTPENLCLHMLGVWKHRLDRDDYAEVARCMDDATSPAKITACAKTHKKK